MAKKTKPPEQRAPKKPRKKQVPPQNSPTHPRMLAAAVKRRQALQLRMAGVDWNTIAEQLGYYDGPAAHHAVTKALSEIPEELKEAKRLELERLDKLYLTYYQRAINGDLEAVDRCLKISARRAKLLGWDIKKHEITGKDGATLLVTTVPLNATLEQEKLLEAAERERINASARPAAGTATRPPPAPG